MLGAFIQLYEDNKRKSDYCSKITKIKHSPERKIKKVVQTLKTWIDGKYEKGLTKREVISEVYIWVVTVMIQKYYKDQPEGSEYEETFYCETKEAAERKVPGHSWSGF
ncbi:MAG: hypothetical protein V4686_01365 [Patescibacteria group bacterium]